MYKAFIRTDFQLWLSVRQSLGTSFYFLTAAADS